MKFTIFISALCIWTASTWIQPSSTYGAPLKKQSLSDHPVEIKGKIQEQIHITNYTYLRLKLDASEEVWVAIPRLETLKAQAEVTLSRPTPMFGFESKTLKRKFDRLYFGELNTQKDQRMNQSKSHSAHPSQKGDAAQSAPTHENSEISVDLKSIQVKKAEGPGSVTVSELFEKKQSFNTKTISLRGKVIKYNPGIMGKNWIHIADGTGSLEKKNFELTLTSLDETKVGDIILVTGVVELNKKIDPYFFPIALENSKIISRE